MGRDWDETYNRNDITEIDDLDNMPFTGKKKKEVIRPFIIEHIYHSHAFGWCKYWRVVGKYKNEASARQAYNKFAKNRVHDAGVNIQYYKQKSSPNELGRFGIFVRGDLNEQYRLIKKD